MPTIKISLFLGPAGPMLAVSLALYPSRAAILDHSLNHPMWLRSVTRASKPTRWSRATDSLLPYLALVLAFCIMLSARLDRGFSGLRPEVVCAGRALGIGKGSGSGSLSCKLLLENTLATFFALGPFFCGFFDFLGDGIMGSDGISGGAPSVAFAFAFSLAAAFWPLSLALPFSLDAENGGSRFGCG